MTERWMKRTTGVPRGLLRFLVLRFLTAEPMSGAEITEKIERETGKKWKPSPGSIYPLLAWLEKKGYSTKLPHEDGMNRYLLTEKGKNFLSKQIEFGKSFVAKLEFLAPMLVGGFQFEANHENLCNIRESAKRVVKTFMDLRVAMKDNLAEQDVKEITAILDDCNEKLETMIHKLRPKGQATFRKQ